MEKRYIFNGFHGIDLVLPETALLALGPAHVCSRFQNALFAFPARFVPSFVLAGQS